MGKPNQNCNTTLIYELRSRTQQMQSVMSRHNLWFSSFIASKLDLRVPQHKLGWQFTAGCRFLTFTIGQISNYQLAARGGVRPDLKQAWGKVQVGLVIEATMETWNRYCAKHCPCLGLGCPKGSNMGGTHVSSILWQRWREPLSSLLGFGLPQRGETGGGTSIVVEK